MTDIPDLAMSNFDGVVPPRMEEWLRCHPGERGTHPAWDHHGQVWWDPAECVFKEEVSRYQAVQAVISAGSLEELMSEVNDRFGWD